MNTFLTERNRAVRRSVRAFCEREIVPIAGEIDRETRFPWEIVEMMGKLGYFGIQVPKNLGGAGMDAMSYVITIEEISRACGSLGLCVTVHNSVAIYPILAFERKNRKSDGYRNWRVEKRLVPSASPSQTRVPTRQESRQRQSVTTIIMW